MLPPESPAAEPSPTRSRLLGIRGRAVFLGFLLCIPVLWAVTNQAVSTIFSMMVPPISALLIAIILNIPLRKFVPKLALNQADLITVFTIVSIAGIAGSEWMSLGHSILYVMPIHGRWSGTYKDYLIKQIPDFMAIKDLALVKDMEGGGRNWDYVLAKIPLFLPKIGMWALLSLSMVFAMQCINSLMRGAWCDRERLTFPLIQLPVAMSEGGGSKGMWKSRAMWIAFTVMFSIDMLNGLNYLYPNLPSLPVKTLMQIDQALKDPPWSQIGDFRISIFPFMAAIGLFMPSDLLLSFVAFFLLRKATHVALAANGIPQGTFSGTGLQPGPPFFDEQTWGGVLAMFLGALWVSKDYLKEVWRDIRNRAPSSDGGIKHTWAFAGLLGCSIIVVVFGCVAGQLPAHYMTLYFGLFLVFSIVMTRIRAQLGPPTHEFAFFGVNAMMFRFFGNKWLTDRQASWLTGGFLMMNRMYRNHPMPIQLESMKMAQMNGIRQKPVFWVMIAAAVAGFFLAYWFTFVRVYRTGSIPWNEASPYLENILRDRKGPDILGIVMTIFGFAVVMVLDAIRFKFPGFPLHPAGYVLSLNFGVDYYWFGLLLALLVKNFVQRYYGLKGYDQLRMVALGILLGEYAAETIWMGMALITKQSTYTISFNDRSLGMQ